MIPERQKILAGEILDLNDKINYDAENNEVDLEDYYTLQKLAAMLARQTVQFSSSDEKQAFIEATNAKVKQLVRYTVDFEATIEYDPETEDEQDAVSDIDIPEGGKNNSRYLENTFNILDPIP